MRYVFLILMIVCLLSGCFGETPEGEPAYHQFFLAALCFILVVLLWREHLKIKKDLDGRDV